MKKIRVLKLGTVCHDKATKLLGTVTHWIYNMGGHVSYFFQPRGIDDQGQPVDKIMLEEARLEISGESDFEEVEVPSEVLGSQITDKASGFTGMAVAFVRHINGCFHVFIQPSGVTGKTNSPIRKHDFDLRSCEGEMIKQMHEAELAKSRQSHPSPINGSFEDADLQRAARSRF